MNGTGDVCVHETPPSLCYVLVIMGTGNVRDSEVIETRFMSGCGSLLSSLETARTRDNVLSELHTLKYEGPVLSASCPFAMD